jgi:DNA repair exonuclease SbcCD ATPase subunit
MIKKLTLTNFKSITHDVINFSAGLNVFRGNSEAGKTTRIDGLMYALFGISALSTSLEETVTYGEPVSSLKVELEMLIDGVTYTISRGKSGAEIHYGDHTVTGQTETKMFIERLLGVDAKLATKLLFASQSNIKGVLEDGPTAASALIETLADLGQIEALVGKVQDQLPCGNTNTLSGQITDAMSDLSMPEPVPPSDTAKRSAIAVVESLNSELERLKVSAHSLSMESKAAQGHLAEVAKIEASNASVASRKLVLAEVKPAVMPSESEESIAELKASQLDAAAQARKYASSRKTFLPSKPFAGTREEFYASKATTSKELDEIRGKKSALAVKAASIKALHVNETTCGFCKKDLSEVPEVIANNEVAARKLAAIEVELTSAKSMEEALSSALLYQCSLEDIDRKNAKVADEFWQASDEMPAFYLWIGGEVIEPGADVGPRIAAVEKAWKEYRVLAARYQSAQAELETLAFTPIPHDDKWQLAIDASFEAERIVKEAMVELYEARVKNAQVDGEYSRALQAYTSEVDSRAKASGRLAELKEKLAETAENNELVKKLRAARPIIANKLWVSVLGAVGHYFSQIRGVRSIISKDDTGFKCDGRSVAGLSGSTKDALGLALRLALVKTFVPTASFISLDEPASGCDANRELAMLGVVAGAGFDQVLLVTHSDLADSFAQQVIQL